MSGPRAVAQDAAAGQASGQAAPKQKQYKDRGEYDLYSAVYKATDPKTRLQALNEWQDKYPQSDYAQDRLLLFVQTLSQLAQTDPAARKQLVDKATELLKADPANFAAAYYISLYGPAVPGTDPTQIANAAHVVIANADKPFAADKKPASVSADQWAQQKNAAISVAYNALAYSALQTKDSQSAENDYKQSLQANPNNSQIAAALGKLYIDDAVAAQSKAQNGTVPPDQQTIIDQKTPLGLYEYARAASYDGPGSLAQAQRDQLMTYFKNTYNSFHGSADGQDQILAQAKTAAIPPDNFTIQSANAIAQGEANALNTRMANDPAFKTWYAIQQNLQQKGDAFFNSDIKDAEIPGEEGGGYFSGTVISLQPQDAPTQVVLGVEDPTKPDATLSFSTPLPADALTVVKPGAVIKFSGVVDSYTATPYMLTFKDPKIEGVKTTTPAKTGHARHKR